MGKNEKKTKKESKMELLDLRDTKVVYKIEGSVTIEKIVSWDNTNNQRGVIKDTYLALTVQGKSGSQRLIIGKTDKNIWIGKASEERQAEPKTEVLTI